MNKTFISITITYYNIKDLDPVIHYYRTDNFHPCVSTFDKLTALEANKLMWELVKLGGENSYSSNMYDNSISTRHVSFYGQL